MSKNKSLGTRQWATKTVNCCTGCSHDCLYCYAKSMAIRFKQVTAAQWSQERIRPHDVYRKHRKYKGRVMFPSSHDITPGNLNACMTVLEKLLTAGNDVLLVSKPHLDCIRTICNAFGHYSDQFRVVRCPDQSYMVDDYRLFRIVLRFTIGAVVDRILNFWEPNAPAYQERNAALKYAFKTGFQTSVSAEPMLDAKNIDLLVSELMPYITDSFWIGEMNHIGRFSKYADTQIQDELNRIKAGQTPAALRNIYNRYHSNPKIKWKNGIKKILGLPMATVPGLDI